MQFKLMLSKGQLHVYLHTYLFIVFLPQMAAPRRKDFFLACSLLCPQCPEQHLA